MKLTFEERAAIADKITKQWAEAGKLIEGGWFAFAYMAGLDDAPQVQKREMRKAYMGGAQHLFASIMNILEPGTEATEGDLDKMTKIHKELEAYVDELKRELAAKQ